MSRYSSVSGPYLDKEDDDLLFLHWPDLEFDRMIDSYYVPCILIRSLAVMVDESPGPVKELRDFTPDEVEELERRLNAKVKERNIL